MHRCHAPVKKALWLQTRADQSQYLPPPRAPPVLFLFISALLFTSHFPPISLAYQIVVYVACSVAAAIMCRLFGRLTDAQKDSVWRHYGSFSLFIAVGCALGAVQTLTYVLQVPEQLFFNNSVLIDKSASEAEQRPHQAAWGLRFRLIAAEYALFGPVLMILTAAKLIALKRMIDFFRRQYSPAANRRIVLGERSALAVAAAATLLICCCGFACTYYASQIAALDIKTANVLGMRPQREKLFQDFQFVQSFLVLVEVAVLVCHPCASAAASTAL